MGTGGTWKAQGEQGSAISPWTLCPLFFLLEVIPSAQRGKPKVLPQSICEVRLLGTKKVMEPQGVVI